MHKPRFKRVNDPPPAPSVVELAAQQPVSTRATFFTIEARQAREAARVRRQSTFWHSGEALPPGDLRGWGPLAAFCADDGDLIREVLGATSRYSLHLFAHGIFVAYTDWDDALALSLFGSAGDWRRQQLRPEAKFTVRGPLALDHRLTPRFAIDLGAALPIACTVGIPYAQVSNDVDQSPEMAVFLDPEVIYVASGDLWIGPEAQAEVCRLRGGSGREFAGQHRPMAT